MESVLFKTDNYYMFSPSKNEFLVLHPLLYSIIKQKELGLTNSEINNSTNFPPNTEILADKFNHYLSRYEFLKHSGYFNTLNVEPLISKRRTDKEIEIAFSNTMLIILEATDSCNLSCKYCAYSELYDNHFPRENVNMDFSVAKSLIDIYIVKRNSMLNKSFHKKTRINFYGGEPLMNFKLISNVVSYISEIGYIDQFDFGMTTNGTLLEKHIDFLIQNEFDLVISLDGDKDCNSFRTFKNGKPTFSNVINCLKKIQKNNSNYFETHIKFNAVYNKNSTIDKIYNFFKSTFDKVPFISEIDANSIDTEKQKEFEKVYNSLQKNFLSYAEDDPILDELRVSNPFSDNLRKIFLNGTFCGTLSNLRNNQAPSRVPTATCVPFSRSIHVTVSGKLFLCERIGHRDSMWDISKGLDIDFQYVADTINKKYDELKENCLKCYGINYCNQCVMQMETSNNNYTCSGFVDEMKFERYLSATFRHFEKKPVLFDLFMIKE